MNDTTFVERGRGRLQDLIDELDRQAQSKVDFVADAREFDVQYFMPERDHAQPEIKLKAMTPAAGEWLPEPLPFTRNGLRQLLAKCGTPVPAQFFDKLPRDGHVTDFIGWLFRNSSKRRLFRVLDGKVRAVQSDAYKMVDHLDLAFHALNTVKACNGEVVECRLTDSNMRIAFTTREVAGRVIAGQAEAGSGPAGWQADHTFRKMTNLQWGSYEPPFGSETVHPLITLRNSETGEGGLHVELGILESACLNMSLVSKQISKVHLGQRMTEGIYAADTRQRMSESILLQVRDVLTRSFDPEWFNQLCVKLNQQAATPIEHPTSAVQNFAAMNKVSDKHRDAILEHFLSGRAYNVFALGRAVSRASQEFHAADATEMEEMAGALMVGRTMVVDAVSKR